MLARVLDQDARMSAFHEPEPYLLREGYLRWRGERGAEWSKRQIQSKRRELVESVSEQGQIYVESSCFLAHLILDLEECFDGPKFIYLYRDGRAFVRTGLEQWWYERVGWIWRTARRVRRSTGISVGRVWEDHKLDPPADLDSRFEKIAWLWAEINSDIVRGLRSIPEDRQMRVRLEEFDKSKLRACIEYCVGDPERAPVGRMVRIAESQPNETEEHHVPGPRRWSEKWKQRFDELAGEMMRELGYT